MSTIGFRIDEKLKKQFYEITEKKGIDPSIILRILVSKIVKNPEIIKFDLDNDLLSDVMQIGENSFGDVWNNTQDDIYSKLYKNV